MTGKQAIQLARFGTMTFNFDEKYIEYSMLGVKTKESFSACRGIELRGNVICYGEKLNLKLKSDDIPQARSIIDAYNEEISSEKKNFAEENTAVANGEAVYSIDGCRGRHIDVYEDKCVISTKVSVGSLLTMNATDGEKTIYYADCIGVQFKEAKLAVGYLQLETASSMMNNRSDNFFNENTFTFEESQIPNAKMRIVADYVRKRIDVIKSGKNALQIVQTQTVSAADELKKFKELLDLGIIKQEEFDAKKKQLLAL